MTKRRPQLGTGLFPSQRRKSIKVFLVHDSAKVYTLSPNIKAKNLGKSLKGRWIYRNLNFEIQAGESLLIQGPNGVGKSVLLQNIAGFWKSDEGSVEIEQNQPKNISFCPFHGGLDEFMKLKDSLLPWIGKQKMQEALKLWGLEEQSRTKVSALSSGQLKRALLARAFAIDTEIILLDEPFVGLDVQYRKQLLEIIKKRLEAQNIIIFTGHHVELEGMFSPTVLNLEVTT